MLNQPDDAIDKVLAALRDAPPPEGMNARIAARLEQANPQRATSSRRALLTGQSLAAAWFCGAATGAAFALLAVAAVLLLRHAPTPPASANNTAPAHNSAPATRVAESRATLCPAPAVLRIHRIVPVEGSHASLAEVKTDTTAPSHPAPPLPLTAQERGLVQIARTGDPKELATINPETQTRLLAQQAAEFDRFFTPPPAKPAASTHE